MSEAILITALGIALAVVIVVRGGVRRRRLREAAAAVGAAASVLRDVYSGRGTQERLAAEFDPATSTSMALDGEDPLLSHASTSPTWSNAIDPPLTGKPCFLDPEPRAGNAIASGPSPRRPYRHRVKAATRVRHASSPRGVPLNGHVRRVWAWPETSSSGPQRCAPTRNSCPRL